MLVSARAHPATSSPRGPGPLRCRGTIARYYLRVTTYRLSARAIGWVGSLAWVKRGYRYVQTCRAPAELALPQTSALPHVSDLRAAIELLSKDLGSPLRVADLARAVNMSPSRFAHVFKEATGVSPHRFRKQLRLERAKFLLDVKGWSVTAVAAEVGYSNVSHFISEFKRIFGRTPGSITGRP